MLKITIDLKKIWTFSLVLYIICSTAFSYGELSMLNTYALYFFFGVSLINIFAKQRLRMNWAVISIIAFGILSWIGLIYTPAALSGAMGVMYSYLTMAILVICVVQYIEDMKDIRVIVIAYMLAGLALALRVYSLYGNKFWDILREAAQNDADYTGRMGDELTNVNVISMYTIISALIAAYFVFFERPSAIKTVLCIAIAVFCFIVSMTAASKKGVVTLLVAIVCLWLYSSLGTKNITKQLRNILILVVSAAVLLYLINTLPIFTSIANRMENMFDFLDGGEGTASEQNRFYYIAEGISVWLDHVLFGEGFAASIYHFGTYSHSNFVEILMNSGVVGFLLFYAPYFVYGTKYFAKAKLYRQTDKLSMILFALLVSILVSSFALVYYYERYYMILFAVIFSAPKYLEMKAAETGAQLSRKENV